MYSTVAVVVKVWFNARVDKTIAKVSSINSSGAEDIQYKLTVTSATSSVYSSSDINTL
jgi:hypothetical protein